MAGRKPAAKAKTVEAKSTKIEEQTKVEEKEVEKPIIPKDIEPNTIVTVNNGFQGKLVYISPRTHERFIWSDFGDEQELELRELRNAKSSAKAFFENNWFMFDEENEWVVPYLGLDRYYKNAVKLEDFDNIFTMSEDEIKSVISEMSSGQKKSLTYRARQLVSDGEIDSRKIIAALEEALGTELIER